MNMTEVNALCTRLNGDTYDEHDAREAAKVIWELVTQADEADRRLALAEDKIREMQEQFDDLYQATMGDEELCEGYEED